MAKVKDALLETKHSTFKDFIEYKEHLEMCTPTDPCGRCFALLRNCRNIDCKGNGKVYHEGMVEECEACAHYADSIDIGR